MDIRSPQENFRLQHAQEVSERLEMEKAPYSKFGLDKLWETLDGYRYIYPDLSPDLRNQWDQLDEEGRKLFGDSAPDLKKMEAKIRKFIGVLEMATKEKAN